MSVSKYVDHLLVLPEDEANKLILNGFILHSAVNQRNLQILPEAGGWLAVLGQFEKHYVRSLRNYPKRRMVLAIDFDESTTRRSEVERRIPPDLRDRVFLIGAWSEPERLRRAMARPLEDIGRALAEDCYRNTTGTWSHELLQHNGRELEALRKEVRPFLFDL